MNLYWVGSATDLDFQRLLPQLPELQPVSAEQFDALPSERVMISDVKQFLQGGWSGETVVIGDLEDSVALMQAWQRGAVAGWLRQDWPANLREQMAEVQMRQRVRLDCQALPEAAQLQQQLLPGDPQMAGYALYRAFQPASFLSGDWIDGWMVDEHHYLCYLADVAGHGLASSLLTAWLASFHRSCQHPLELLKRINQHLLEQKISRHITAIVVLLDTRQHQVHWCSAGHYPGPIVILPDRRIQLLKSSSLPLGLSDWVDFKMETLELQPNSRIILSSDGTLELFKGPLQERVDQLAAQLADYSFVPQRAPQDDVTLLCIHRLSPQRALPSSGR